MDKPQRRAEEILDTYASNAWLADRLAGEINHEESLLQIPFPANCLNWVVGHIIDGRCTALSLMNLDPIWTEDVRRLYQTGSEPITPGSQVRNFEQLLDDLTTTQEMLQDSLLKTTQDDLEKLGTTDRGEKKVADHLSGLAWHETFHVGQIDMLVSFIISQREAVQNT